MSMTDQQDKLLDCPVLVVIKAISGKWKTRILWLLRDRPYHFGELRKTLPGVSAKVLDEQLKQLEQDGLIARREELRGGLTYVIYSYSDYGRSLVPLLDDLGSWGAAHHRRQVRG